MFEWLTGNRDPNEIYNSMKGGVELTDTSFQQKTGQQMFDPNSSYNQRQLGAMRQGTSDQMAMGGLLGQRSASAGQGFGGRQRMQADNAKFGNQLHQGFNQHMQQAANTGTGLLGQALQGQSANMQTQQGWADARSQQMAQNSANTGGMFQGLLGGLAGGAMGGAFGSLGGLINLGGEQGNGGFGQQLMQNMGGRLSDMTGFQMPNWAGGLLNMGGQ